MTKTFSPPARPTILAIAALLGLATACTVAADAVETGETGEIGDSPLACAVHIRHDGGALVLEGLVRSQTDLAGTYAFAVDGPGTRLRQGGPFTAAAGQTARLGRATLSGDAAGLDASLQLTTQAGRVACPVVGPDA